MPLLKDVKKVLVIGSGPIIIGQAAEFDYAGTQACLALKEEGIEVVLLNNNPATIMTDASIADTVYIEPLNIETIEKILVKEKPDGLIGSLGGQTGLNLAVQLEEQGILKKYGVKLLGTSAASIKKGEDRELFRNLMLEIEEPIPASKIVHDSNEGMAFAEEQGYPLIVRPAYTLGGTGGGYAGDKEELRGVLKRGLELSPINQVLLEQSIKGFKEIEFEVMRDSNDSCIIVASMENVDPVGVHTGDSIVVAPALTISSKQYQVLRESALKIIRVLDIIGGCNIQFALNPDTLEYYVIEVNPRVSRSSALASKATGYPIARIATKCAVGYHLDELVNPITGSTFASFEPTIDYVVIKLPRFAFDKFAEGERNLGTQMKATGEVMAIDRSFEGALNKGLRSLEMNVSGLYLARLERSSLEEIKRHLVEGSDLRLFAIAEAFRRGISVDEVKEYTQIDEWFLGKIKELVQLEVELKGYSFENAPDELLVKAKEKNMADSYLARLWGVEERLVRAKSGKVPGYKLVDTCAGQFEAESAYFYSTYKGIDEVKDILGKKILVLGSGPIRIGQGVEFDYCSVHAAFAVRESGYVSVVINNNPETVSTDYTTADRLYFEPLTVEDILNVAKKEEVEGVLVQFGGQTAINVAEGLSMEGLKLLGTSIENINRLEDREEFYSLLASLDIPHIPGESVFEPDEVLGASRRLGYPVLVRPSYVIGGQAMYIFHEEKELEEYVEVLRDVDQRTWPLLVDRYLPGLECEVDVITDGEDILIPGILEHVEKAGVHSGDSINIFPPVSLGDPLKEEIVEYSRKIAKALPVQGLMNIQFVVTDRVYVLEVNPRSSRTVPIMSKITGVPIVELGTRVQLGERLRDLWPALGLLPEPGFYAVKVPVFSSHKLKGVDYVLGPEMKSTGERLGLGFTVEEAMAKALGENPLLKSGSIFLSIADREKEDSLEVIEEIVKRGFKLFATERTAEFLKARGYLVRSIPREKEAIKETLLHMDLVINMASQGRVKDRLGFYIRQEALRLGIECYTCLDTVRAALLVEQSDYEVRSVREYLA